MVPAPGMLQALGEVMEKEEEMAEQERLKRKQELAEKRTTQQEGEEGGTTEVETEQLMTEIEKLVASGKGWTASDRRKYLNELHEGPELAMFCEDTNEMDPRMVEALAALKYDGELPAKVVSKQVEIFQRGNRKGKLAEQMAEGINATIREQYEERRQKDLLDSAEAEVQKLDEMQRLMGYLHEKKSHQWADYRATDEAEFAMLKKGAEADKLFLRELSKEQFH